jgi:sec-independent protein translocase protein TatA
MVLIETHILQIPTGLEWIIILIVIVLVFFGFKKIPELARSFGKASSQYQKAKIEAERGLEMLKGGRLTKGQEREKLEQIAETLGIDYLSMSDDEIRTAIETKINKTKNSHE